MIESLKLFCLFLENKKKAIDKLKNICYNKL